MKTIKQCIVVSILALPCLLTLNDNDNVIINVVGLLYCIVFVLCVKYHERLKGFRKSMRNMMESMNQMNDSL